MTHPNHVDPPFYKDRLREIFESLPLSTYLHNTSGEDDDPQAYLSTVFGPDTVVEPMIYCAEIGTWIEGWSVLTSLPEGGVYGFALKEAGNNETPWANSAKWRRLKTLSHSVAAGVYVAADMNALINTLVARLIAEATDSYYDFDTSGTLNHEPVVWLLRHALKSLDDEQAEATRFLMALAHPTSDWGHVQRLVQAADHIATNWKCTAESEEAVKQAVQRYNGVELNPAQIERLAIPGALMAYPREEWGSEADRIVKAVYKHNHLGSEYHPKPSTPPIPSGMQKYRGWPILAA